MTSQGDFLSFLCRLPRVSQPGTQLSEAPVIWKQRSLFLSRHHWPLVCLWWRGVLRAWTWDSAFPSLRQWNLLDPLSQSSPWFLTEVLVGEVWSHLGRRGRSLVLEPLDTQNPRDMGIQNPRGRQFLDSQGVPTSFCAPGLSVLSPVQAHSMASPGKMWSWIVFSVKAFLGRSMKVSTQITWVHDIQVLLFGRKRKELKYSSVGGGGVLWCVVLHAFGLCSVYEIRREWWKQESFPRKAAIAGIGREATSMGHGMGPSSRDWVLWENMKGEAPCEAVVRKARWAPRSPMGAGQVCLCVRASTRPGEKAKL